ncbi:MAG: type I restriction endonuclease subunit R [Motilibacteraceae bacterium]
MGEARQYLTPEARARLDIDDMLEVAGWVIQNRDELNLAAGRGVAVREFLLAGNTEVDYLLFVDGQALGALEAKKAGTPLIGVEPQTAKYASGLPAHVQAPVRPLPFLYESTGVETQFTNALDPTPRSREVFAVHRPETLARWLAEWRADPAHPTFRARLHNLPDLDTSALWPAQERAITALEDSLAHDRPRSLIQMATGSGKTFTAANAVLRLVRGGGAGRVLFLVDRSNLGRQTMTEFERFTVPGDGRKFTELYTVQRLTSNRIDPDAKVVISTIQRLYSILRGEESFDDELDEASPERAIRGPAEVEYNPAIPPEMFDLVVVDECHRSIYGQWSQVLSYFDAYIIGLTATPSKQTLGFFRQNLVFAYTHEEAVADQVNVDFDVYRIRTSISETGSTIEAGTWTAFRDRSTRKRRWEELEDDLVYDGSELDRNVVAEDQIRTVIRHFRDVYGTELFPGRTTVPKTLIFAKDDSHADDIVRIVREEFGRGNDFAVKITYRTTGKKPEELLAEFRTSTLPRIAVTVDMIATGTDVKPLECLIFMRTVRSRNFFEQMKGRGVRVVSDDDLQAVSPGASAKTRFVLIDAVGVTEVDMGEARPLERKKAVALKALFEQVAAGSRDPDVVASIASRLTRLDRQLTKPDRAELADLADGVDLRTIAHALVRSIDVDAAYADAQAAAGGAEPTPEQVAAARAARIDTAVQVLATNPTLRTRILEVRSSYEQVLDTVSTDSIVEARFSRDATERAKQTVADWRAFIEENKDELSALQILYAKPAGKRLTFTEVRELANAISRPPRAWTTDLLWNAYETLEQSRVRGHGGKVLTDLVSLVRFTLEEESELMPWEATVEQRFAGWVNAQQQAGRTFTDMQLRWLTMLRDHLAGSLTVAPADLMDVPFTQHGGLAKARELFGADLDPLLEELTEVLAA